jgi:hypothetical protein
LKIVTSKDLFLCIWRNQLDELTEFRNNLDMSPPIRYTVSFSLIELLKHRFHLPQSSLHFLLRKEFSFCSARAFRINELIFL